MLGEHERAVERLMMALRLSPIDPALFTYAKRDFLMLICWRDATRKRLLGQRRDYAISEVSPAVCGALQRARRWQVSLTKRERSFDICWNSIRRCVSPTSGSGSRHFSLRILQSMSKACERLACRSEKLALEVRSAISGSASIACCCVLFRTIEWRAVLDKSANTYVLVVAV
jgi:hypothetical protein